MKLRVLSALSALITSLILLSSTMRPESPSVTIHSNYLDDLELFTKALEDLESAATNADRQAIQKATLQARLTYKHIEPLLSYRQPQAVNDHINGAPLPKHERKVPGNFIQEPTGLQVIDELVFLGDFEDIQSELPGLVKELQSEFENMLPYAKMNAVNSREAFEAMRLELIRIYTLGVTGFDTPGSGNALPEAKASLEAIQSIFAPFEKAVSEKEPLITTRIETSFHAGFELLGNQSDFDSFDRMGFYKDAIGPLYADIREAQIALGIETVEEVKRGPFSINYHAPNLFSADFLNPYFYTFLTPNANIGSMEELGRTLFFDPILSENLQRSCSSCHDPKKGFSDGQTKSIAYNFEGTVNRNAPGLINAVYADKYFWGLRADNLDKQAEHVITNDKEFHTTIPDMLDRLNRVEEYREAFKRVFPKGGEDITRSQFAKALTAYTSSLRAWNSPFDRYIRGETEDYPEEAIKGYNVFMGKGACGTCHFAPHFSGLVPPLYTENESEILGVPETSGEDSMDSDAGRGGSGVIHDASEIYLHSFKTPTVRNVTLTAPYMHNGVYGTLEEVMAFYNKGGGEGLGYEVPYQTLPFDSLSLSESEIRSVIAFMETLTDTTGLNQVPRSLPQSLSHPELNERKIGGTY